MTCTCLTGAVRIQRCPLHEAAPELLEALKQAIYAIRACDEDFDIHPAYIKGSQAINKAEGR